MASVFPKECFIWCFVATNWLVDHWAVSKSFHLVASDKGSGCATHLWGRLRIPSRQMDSLEADIWDLVSALRVHQGSILGNEGPHEIHWWPQGDRHSTTAWKQSLQQAVSEWSPHETLNLLSRKDIEFELHIFCANFGSRIFWDRKKNEYRVLKRFP